MNRLFRRIGIMLLAAAVFAANPALARNVTADLNDLAQLLRDMGHNVEVRQTDGESYLRIKDKDFYGYSLFLYGCDDKGTHCKSIQLFSSFEPKTMPSLSDINEYNRTHRFGRAYLDKQGFPVLLFDLNLKEGGMNEALFVDTLGLWEAMVEVYTDFLFGKPEERGK